MCLFGGVVVVFAFAFVEIAFDFRGDTGLLILG